MKLWRGTLHFSGAPDRFARTYHLMVTKEADMRIRSRVALASVVVGLAAGLAILAVGVWLARLAWSLDVTYRVLLGGVPAGRSGMDALYLARREDAVGRDGQAERAVRG